jgi:hypothetical protein
MVGATAWELPRAPQPETRRGSPLVDFRAAVRTQTSPEVTPPKALKRVQRGGGGGSWGGGRMQHVARAGNHSPWTAAIQHVQQRGMAFLQPHRPLPEGASGLCCEHCSRFVAWNELKGHYHGGCPALTAG